MFQLRSLASALTILLATASFADEVVLQNGRRLQGTARVLADDRIEIVQAGGTLILPGSMVDRIEAGPSLEQLVSRRLGASPAPGAAELYQLAQTCARQGAATLARQLHERVIALDPDHALARRALGYRHTESGWLSESEYRAWRGEILFRGDWVKPEERDRQLAWEQARAEAEAARAAPDMTTVVVNVQSAPSAVPYFLAPIVVASPFVPRGLHDRAVPPLLAPRPGRERPMAPPAPRSPTRARSNRGGFRSP